MRVLKNIAVITAAVIGGWLVLIFVFYIALGVVRLTEAVFS